MEIVQTDPSSVPPDQELDHVVFTFRHLRLEFSVPVDSVNSGRNLWLAWCLDVVERDFE